MSPNDSSRQVIFDFVHVGLNCVQSSLIKSYFSICVGIMINYHSFNWAFEVEINLVERFFITYNKIFDYMCNERFIIEDCIKFLFSDDVLASEITGLFNNK